MSEPVDGANADEKTKALIAADQLIDRLREDVVEGLKPDGPRDPAADDFDPEDPEAVPPETNEESAFGQVVGELDTAPEIDQVRAALGEPPVEKTKAGPGLTAAGREAD